MNNIQKILQEVSEEICDTLCKYRETADDEGLCDFIRDGEHTCPLDKLNQTM